MLWKEEFKRNFFNIKTILLLVILIFIGLASIYFSYQNKQEYIKTYESNFEDINKNAMFNLIQNYNGIKFNLDFMLSSDFIDIYIIVLLLFSGIFLSSHIIDMIDNGQVNLLLSRTSYKKHLVATLKAQALYIFTIICITMFIILITGFIVGGYGNGFCYIGEYKITIISLIPICIYQILITSVNIIMINFLSLLLCYCINKKILIQLLPFLGFTILPMIISSTIGNIITPLGKISALFVPFRNLKNLYWILQFKFDFIEILFTILPYITYVTIFILFYNKNTRKYSEDCI